MLGKVQVEIADSSPPRLNDGPLVRYCLAAVDDHIAKIISDLPTDLGSIRLSKEFGLFHL